MSEIDALAQLVSDIDWNRPYTAAEVQHIIDNCPFLQIVSTGDNEPFEKPEFITARSGWKIHHYGDAMSCSPGELLFGAQAKEDDEGGSGTIVRQAYETAAQMIQLAQEFGWAGIRIIDGHPLMQWAAWMQASDDEYHLEGFEPTEEDQQKRERIKRPNTEDEILQTLSTFQR